MKSISFAEITLSEQETLSGGFYGAPVVYNVNSNNNNQNQQQEQQQEQQLQGLFGLLGLK